MSMPIQAVTVPLFDDGEGGLRVRGTRVLLERIVHAFENGATPESIVQSYDTLALADVYAIVSWYLLHQSAIKDYLESRTIMADGVRQRIEAGQPRLAALRSRLTAQRNQEKLSRASTGQ